jgi:membrane-associated phospholipid phosphatase
MTHFDRFFCVMKKPWIIFLYALIVALAYSFADKPIAIYFHHLDLRSDAPLLHIISALGKWIIYVGIFSVFALFFRYVKKNELWEQRMWFLLACVVVTNGVGIVLKIILSRSRPDLLFNRDFFGFYWFKLNDLFWSFPSGHSITIAGVAAGLGVLFPRYFYAFLGLALLVISTRIFLYFHYLSDVMTGFYLSILIVGLFAQRLKKTHFLTRAFL